MKYKASVDVVEINRYAFTVEADSKEEAEKKLEHHLKGNAPYPCDTIFNGITCDDRESAWETRETESIIIE